MIKTRNIFKTIFKKRRNNYVTNKIIKEELYIPESAIELTNNEMEYIYGGAIEARRCGFMGLRAKVIIRGTVAELASFLTDAATVVGFIAFALSLIPVIGAAAAISWISGSATIIGFVSTLVSKTSWASNTKFNLEFLIL